MGSAWIAVCGVLLLFLQAAAAEESSCVPGFESELLIFKVTRKHLRQGTRLGKVGFTDCTDRTRFLFSTDDSRFVVQTDGVVSVKRQVVLHEGHRDFYIHSWNSQGQKFTVPAMLVYHKHDGHGESNSQTETNSDTQQVAVEPKVIRFPKYSGELSRKKRGWVIPPLSVSENHRGPYPLRLNQIISDRKEKMFYSITGPGADLPPLNLFTMDRNSGILYVTQELDREKQASYLLKAHAMVDGGGEGEPPMDITVLVIDQNDNKPIFTESSYLAKVPEASPKGFEVTQVVAKDADEPNTDNSDLRYRILSQQPEVPTPFVFIINQNTGVIRVNEAGLDREKTPEYKLVVQAADMMGEGLQGSATVIIKVTDSNDHAPVFTESPYAGTVEENKVGAEVVRMLVADNDEPHSESWNAKFKIVDGDPGNLFAVNTSETNKQEGIITTAKALDFEKTNRYTLLVRVENEIPFAIPLSTSTATVVVTVKDVNEPPIFNPQQKEVSKKEDLAVGSGVVQFTASDPDIARKQKVMYKIITDRAGWFKIDQNTGDITVKKEMDRESPFVVDNKYTAFIGAFDDDPVPATGTGTLVVHLEDVNDNAPIIEEREFKICNKNPAPQYLTVTDLDGPGFTSPFSVSLQDSAAKANWTAKMNGTKTGIILTLTRTLESGSYNVPINVADNQDNSQLSTVMAQVCDCSGEEVMCTDTRVAGADLPVILGILGGVLLLLMLLLLLLMFAKRKPRKKEPLLPQDDDIRDDIFTYDEEGGGEEDQDYDLGVLHRGLDNRPGVFRDDVAPVFMPAPIYKPRPANPEDIGNFIDDNLKAADNDPTAPPYDSLLVFDYEGGGSEAGTLSSLNSSSEGDQDYDCLSDWGPRFKKLADMYGGGDDDML